MTIEEMRTIDAVKTYKELQQAGAIYKAARDYKVDDVSYWRRKRGKGSK
jgi:hypothetical protein